MYHNWEMGEERDDNIKTEIKQIRWEFVDWIYLLQDKHKWTAVAKKVTNLRVPSSTGDYLSC
jgi:hypothetical protein